MNLFPAPTTGNGALLSPCERYRYSLWRRIGSVSPLDPQTVVFIGLNPSTADASQDDPTIRRCLGFAERIGANKLLMLNLYAFRATDPKALWTLPEEERIGPENDVTLLEDCRRSSRVIAAWGDFPKARARVQVVVETLRTAGVELSCLGTAKSGNPRHPLYLASDAPLVPWHLPAGM